MLFKHLTVIHLSQGEPEMKSPSILEKFNFQRRKNA